MKSVYGYVNLYESKNRMKPCHCYAAVPMADWWKRERRTQMGKPWKSKNKPLFVSTDGSRLKIPELAGREEELGDLKGCRRGGLGLAWLRREKEPGQRTELWKASAGNHAAGPSCAAGFL